MRTLMLLGLVGVVGACQSPPSVSSTPMRGTFVDASASRGPQAAANVVAPDPVVAEVLRGAFNTYEERRRVAIENLANVGTPAYRRQTVQTSVQSVAGCNGASYSVPVVIGTSRDSRQGALEMTGRRLDVAIDGEGFFSVTLPDGSTGYRRDGCFRLNADGKVVFANSTPYFGNTEGNVLVPEISVPSDTLHVVIDPEGRFTGRTAGSPDTTTTFGQIMIHRFVNPAGLRFANGIYRPTEASGAPWTSHPGQSGLGWLKQGFLERSNVNAVDEAMKLQALERQHQSLMRVLQQFGMVAP